jgi:hypothetical protein
MKRILFILLVLAITINSYGQSAKNDTVKHQYFMSTSLWSLANLGEDPADFYELNFGYRLTSKDAIILNATTWKYPEPLGIPYGHKDKYAKTKEYDGYIRAFGVGVVYQRFVWKHLFTNVHVNGFLQNFYNDQNEKLQSGFQLYLQFRVGYKWEMFDDRFFIEPAISFNYWPVNTNFPDDFKQVEKEWPDYFLFEPHLNIGINF